MTAADWFFLVALWFAMAAVVVTAAARFGCRCGHYPEPPEPPSS